MRYLDAKAELKALNPGEKCASDWIPTDTITVNPFFTCHSLPDGNQNLQGVGSRLKWLNAVFGKCLSLNNLHCSICDLVTRRCSLSLVQTRQNNGFL